MTKRKSTNNDLQKLHRNIDHYEPD